MKFKINKDQFHIIVLVIMMHNCFDFFAVTDGFFGIKYSDILFLYCAYLIVFYFLRYPKNYFAGRFSIVIFIVPILIFLSSLMAYLFYNQHFIAGIATQRAWFITMFLYFPLRALMINKKLTLDIFWKILYFVVGIEVLVYLLQYIIGPEHYFLSVAYTYRYEGIRIVANTAYMELLLLHATSQVLKKINLKVNIFYIIWILLYVFLVNKGRGQAIICVILIAGAILLTKTNKLYKAAIITIVLTVSFNFLMGSNAIKEFTSIIFEGSDDATYNVRERSQEFYINKLNDEPLAWIYGYGMQNTTLASTQNATGISQGYLITDNGIYGFLFSYGLFGLIWYIYSLSIQLIMGWKIYRKKKDSIIIVKIFKDIISYATYVWFFYTYHSFYSVLFFILIELYCNEIKTSKDNNYNENL